MPSVLIVDDEQHIRLLIEQTLEELEDDGVELLTAPDGEVALDVVRNQSPDLVFLDVTMPKLNGFETCTAIKQDLGLTDTFVCMLTAKGQALLPIIQAMSDFGHAWLVSDAEHAKTHGARSARVA